MFTLLLAVLILTLFIRQFYGTRVDRWRARGEALKPIGQYFSADVRAVVRYARLRRQRLHQVDWDRLEQEMGNGETGKNPEAPNNRP